MPSSGSTARIARENASCGASARSSRRCWHPSRAVLRTRSDGSQLRPGEAAPSRASPFRVAGDGDSGGQMRPTPPVDIDPDELQLLVASPPMIGSAAACRRRARRRRSPDGVADLQGWVSGWRCRARPCHVDMIHRRLRRSARASSSASAPNTPPPTKITGHSAFANRSAARSIAPSSRAGAASSGNGAEISTSARACSMSGGTSTPAGRGRPDRSSLNARAIMPGASRGFSARSAHLVSCAECRAGREFHAAGHGPCRWRGSGAVRSVRARARRSNRRWRAPRCC